jgi:hypothetical protein
MFALIYSYMKVRKYQKMLFKMFISDKESLKTDVCVELSDEMLDI